MSETDLLSEIERLKEVIKQKDAQIATIRAWVEQQLREKVPDRLVTQP